jgi:hypothetical protein
MTIIKETGRFRISGWIIISLMLFFSCKNNIGRIYPDGGYNYPTLIMAQDSDFYFVPLRNKFSRTDSLFYSYQYQLYKYFDEPNLSLRAEDSDIYRFVISGPFDEPIIIKLEGHEMMVKMVTSHNSMISFSDEKLTELEALHYHILERRFPIGEKAYKPWVKHYLDSMVAVYPQLLDVKYYDYLIKKRVVPADSPFVYATKKIILEPQHYDSFIHMLDTSGYWKLPYWVDCKEPPTDGWGFDLEANTKEKYNFVSTSLCSISDESTKFKRACMLLIQYANLSGKFNLLPSDSIISVNVLK